MRDTLIYVFIYQNIEIIRRTIWNKPEYILIYISFMLVPLLRRSWLFVRWIAILYNSFPVPIMMINIYFTTHQQKKKNVLFLSFQLTKTSLNPAGAVFSEGDSRFVIWAISLWKSLNRCLDPLIFLPESELSVLVETKWFLVFLGVTFRLLLFSCSLSCNELW